MKSFYAGMGLVAIALVAATWQWRGGAGEITSFYGVVNTAETIVSAELPVEVTRLRVAPGQPVRAGDTLVDLASSELERNIAELRHSLNESRVARIAEDREIEAQVAEIEAQYKLNRSLLTQVRGGRDDGADDGAADDGASPLRAAIQGLKGMLAREELSTADMEAYLALLLRERDKLIAIAPGPGVIGTVHRRAGERVKAFEPVLTLYTGSPVTVRGYLHESAHGLIENGQGVRVRSLVSRYELAGEVVGIGHRIVEYPVRLRKRADIQMWGREVIIRIPDTNAFLLGEKVMIDMRPARKDAIGAAAGKGGARPMFPGIAAHAAPPSPVSPSSPSPPPVDRADWELPGVEASGILFLADVGRFLVVSDDTPKKRPQVHVVNSAGAMEGVTEIRGLPAVNDMEAIAQDAAGRIYVATSQSRNKSGKFPETRRLLIRAVREGTALRLDASVLLHDALAAAAQNNAGNTGNAAAWAEWFRAGTEAGTLDMEGIAPDGEGLLLGFKAPLRKGRAVILRVRDRDGLLGGAPLPPDGVSLWDAPDLRLPGADVSCGISDLFFHDGALHVLGTAVREDAADGVTGGGGGWWIVHPGKAPRLVRAFPGMKPEGIAYDPRADVFRIALDEGANKPSRVLASRFSAR